MILSIIYFTEKGEILSKKITDICDRFELDGRNYTTLLYDGRNKNNPQTKAEWIEQQMIMRNPIIFIGACGIAVRLMAPYIQSKLTDSPVLVIDELGHFVIPVLSGHVGGANELAKELSDLLDATAVITTATDLENKFAVDMFARKNGLTIVNKEGIAKVSSKILRSDKATVYIDEDIAKTYSEKDVTGNLHFQIGHYKWSVPSELSLLTTYDGSQKADIYIGTQFANKGQLNLCIKQYVVGVGCRKGKSGEELNDFIISHCKKINVDISQVAVLVSIDVKKDEEGLISFTDIYRIPFITYSKEILQQAPGVFASSAFVESKVGVDNVCERSVMTYISQYAKGKDITEKLVLNKQAENGMTIAIGRL